MRVFIAIEFEDDIKNQISDLQNKVQSECKKGFMTDKENLNLTMRFLGDVNGDELEYVAEAMDESVRRMKTFKLDFDRLGYFDRVEECILWLGIKSNSELSRLYMSLSKALEKQGFKRDRSKFSPHITLGRELKFYTNKNAVISKSNCEISSLIVKNISLMESKRENGKLIYKRIYTSKLI